MSLTQGVSLEIPSFFQPTNLQRQIRRNGNVELLQFDLFVLTTHSVLDMDSEE
jgi:hypothetical protein